VAKQQRVDVCTELRHLVSDDETFLSRISTGDWHPVTFSYFQKLIEAGRTPV
jgi:hypothetical protein